MSTLLSNKSKIISTTNNSNITIKNSSQSRLGSKLCNQISENEKYNLSLTDR